MAGVQLGANHRKYPPSTTVPRFAVVEKPRIYNAIPRFANEIGAQELTEEQLAMHKAAMEANNIDRIEVLFHPKVLNRPIGATIHYKASIEPESAIFGLRKHHHFTKHKDVPLESLGDKKCKLCWENKQKTVPFAAEALEGELDDREFFVVSNITACYYMWIEQKVELYFLTEWKPESVKHEQFARFFEPVKSNLDAVYQSEQKKYKAWLKKEYKRKQIEKAKEEEEAKRLKAVVKGRNSRISHEIERYDLKYVNGLQDKPRASRKRKVIPEPAKSIEVFDYPAESPPPPSPPRFLFNEPTQAHQPEVFGTISSSANAARSPPLNFNAAEKRRSHCEDENDASKKVHIVPKATNDANPAIPQLPAPNPVVPIEEENGTDIDEELMNDDSHITTYIEDILKSHYAPQPHWGEYTNPWPGISRSS